MVARGGLETLLPYLLLTIERNHDCKETRQNFKGGNQKQLNVENRHLYSDVLT